MKSVLQHAVTYKADIWWFGSTVADILTPNYQFLSSLYVRDMMTQSEAHILVAKTSYFMYFGLKYVPHFESSYLEHTES